MERFKLSLSYWLRNTYHKGTLTGKRAESIASPEKYPNLFDQYEESLTAEQFYKSTSAPQLASDYGDIEAITERDLIEESIGFEADDVDEQEEDEVEQEAEAEVEEDEPEVEGWGHQLKLAGFYRVQ